MKKLMVVAMTSLLSMAVFADEPAQSAKGGRFRMMGGGANDSLIRAVLNPKVAEGIGLSEAQKAKLAEFKGVRDANRELQKKVGEGMKRQMELLQAETIDEAAVMASIDEVFEVRKQMAKEQTKRIIAIRSVLTPEQIKKARELMKEKRSAEKRNQK